MKKKSQMAIEFVILMGLGMIIAMLVIILVYDMNTDRNKEKIYVKMEDFASSLQNELMLASQMNNGYYRNFTIPEKIGNTPYTLSLENDSDFMRIIIIYNDRTIYKKIPYIYGNIIKGNNHLQKIGGEIYISS